MSDMNFIKEKIRQENCPWERSVFYEDYSQILGYYQAVSCIDNAQKGSLLDLACGDGSITGYFVSKFTTVEGVDASATHLNKAKQLNPTVIFHHSLIETFEVDNKFNTVTMLNLLEHVENPINILKKAASFLKPNGRLIVHVPNAEAINRKIAVKMGTLINLEELSPFDINIAGHRRTYTMDCLIKDINCAGLNVMGRGGVFYKMLSMAQMDWFLKNAPWKSGGFGWGRMNEEIEKDWKKEFCRACYEIGKEYPKECNIIYAVITN